jgi:hypothetical protein
MKITIKQYDAITNEETVTERDETSEETLTRENLIAQMDQEVSEIQTKAANKASAEAKLSSLGLTPEEIAALR